MKTAMAVLTSVAVLGLSVPSTSAGDKEWATAGKILTGVVAGAALAKALEPVPVYYAPAYSVPVVQAPPPVVVRHAPIVVRHAPIAVQSAPVIVYQQPVLVRPAPIYVPAPVVYVAPRPVVHFSLGFGHRHHHQHHHGPPVHRFGW